MARYDFTENNLSMVSMMNRHQLAGWLHVLLKGSGSRRGERTMDIIRGLQCALSIHSKRVGKFDRVQDKMLAVLGKMEKWLRLEYVRIRMPEMIAMFPSFPNNPTEIKRRVQADWESYFKRNSY